VVRDAEAANRPLEVFLGVTPAAGQAAGPLVVELPAGADRLTVAVPPEYAGATVQVLDASPFPRACGGDRGCVAMLGGPLTAPIELAPSDQPRQAAAPSVPLDKLRRLTGESAIPPSDDMKAAAAGKPLGAAIVRLCLGPDGKVESTRIVKSSGAPAYDDQLQATIKASWRFEPVARAEGAVDNQTAAVCTTATFIAR
jgi:TonB family protein